MKWLNNASIPDTIKIDENEISDRGINYDS
jgi:hypothetical protein